MPSRMGVGGRHRWIHAEAFPRQREMTGRLIGENPKTLAYEATYVRDGVRSGGHSGFDGKGDKGNARRLTRSTVCSKFSLLCHEQSMALHFSG